MGIDWVWSPHRARTRRSRILPARAANEMRNVASRYDIIVVGLGGLGSAVAYHASLAGKRVLGVEQFQPGHDRGSSHGLTRIIRLPYHEGEQYVPLLKRAWDLWQDLQASTGLHCLHKTGCLEVGSRVVPASRAAADAHGLKYQLMTAREAAGRFPGYMFPDSEPVLFCAKGGALKSEQCIAAHTLLAHDIHKADLLHDVQVLGWAPAAPGPSAPPGHAGVTVQLAGGLEVDADALVLAGGAWIPELVPELRGYLQPERQVTAWFQVDESEGTPGAGLHAPRHPVWIYGHPNGENYYGFPQVSPDAGLKVGRMHHLRQAVQPDGVSREVTPEDVQVLREVVRECFPAAAEGCVLRAGTCLFTNTPDLHFLVGRHPTHPQVIVGSACSGHGFKFASSLGEAIAALAMNQEPRVDISSFGFQAERPGMARVLRAMTDAR